MPRDVTWNDTVPFVIPVNGGRVIKVYDGDSITVASFLPHPQSQLYRIPVRLNGIDTPELRTSDESEKQLAVMARDALSNLIMGKWVMLENTAMDKYGRLLADVFVGKQRLHLNQLMIDQRFATDYGGGTKHSPDDWMRFHRGLE